MSNRVQAIETRLRQTLNPETMEVHDESAAHAGHAGAASGGGHFAVTIVAAAFSGQNAVARHRMIYEALADMRQEIHALSIRALAPDEL
ncbi:MAG: BolA family protein [Acidiferrobacteraceae bacterium]